MNNIYCPCCLKTLIDGACPDGCPGVEQPAHFLQPGTVLHDRYLLGRAIGQGGFGITYLGRDLTLDIRVAVKEYYPGGLASRGTGNAVEYYIGADTAESFAHEKSKFLSEARVLAQFTGEKGIVDVRDFFEENGTGYIVMEYLDGRTLSGILKSDGKIPPARVFELMRPVMRSLEKIHGVGLIHRDISPDKPTTMLLKTSTASRIAPSLRKRACAATDLPT